MKKEEKINKLLEEYKRLVRRLNRINEEMNEVGTDSEDMIPGHDEGAEWYAKFEKYKATREQVRLITKELRGLGYKYSL